MSSISKIQAHLHCGLVLLLFTTTYCKLAAQDPESYNSIYTKTYLDISQKDFPRALKIADSLYSISETPRFKAKSLMLSASLLQQAGEISKAVNYAARAEQVLKDTDEYVWRSKVSGFLATQYRQLKLYDQSRKYIDETIENVKKVTDQRLADQTMGFVMQEKAYCEIELKNYKKSIAHVNSATSYFRSSGVDEPFLTANNEQLLGLNYFHLGNHDKALEYYEQSLDKLDKMPDNFLKALVLNGIADVYIAMRSPEKARPLIEKAQKLANESPHLSLKNEIYETSQRYYALTRDIESLEQSKLRQDSVREKISVSSSKFINDSYTSLKERENRVEKKSREKTIVIALSLLLIAAGSTYFIIYRRRQKRNFEKVRQILEELERPIEKNDHISEIEKSETVERIIPIGIDDSEETGLQTLMTALTEKKILIKLARFEQSSLFTRSSVSLPYVAAYCGTNTKYLSYVVNTHKGKDFKNYINELRIRYIIQKLKNDSQYQKYKISTLAEESGFSSQSKFAAAFRKVTTVPPSEFLDHLRSQQLN